MVETTEVSVGKQTCIYVWAEVYLSYVIYNMWQCAPPLLALGLSGMASCSWMQVGYRKFAEGGPPICIAPALVVCMQWLTPFTRVPQLLGGSVVHKVRSLDFLAWGMRR